MDEEEVSEEREAPEETEAENPTEEVADDATESVSELSGVLASLAALDAKLDTVLDSLTGFRETVNAMKVDGGAVVRDSDSADDVVEVSDLPDPRERDYSL